MNNKGRHTFIFIKNESAFALPQILLLCLGLSIGISALISVSINRLTSTRVRSLQMQARNASDSAVFGLRSLLNNSRTREYNYFWLLKSCSLNSSNNQCPSFGGGPRCFYKR